MVSQEGTQEAALLGELLARRHSCRAFLPGEVPRATIEQMLELAQRTATWCNTQPWQIFLSRGENARRLKEKLRHAAGQGAADPDLPFPPEYRGEHLARRREAGFQLYAAAGIEKGDRVASRALALRNFELFGAPHCAVMAMPAYLGPYAALDCGGWIANFLLAAEAHGVAAIPQAALAQQSPVLREHFGIAQESTILCGIAFGFEDKASALNSYRTGRAALCDACTWHEDP